MRMDSTVLVKDDCLYFNGYKPCVPHKRSGVHCEGCPEYAPRGPNVLVIKLQAAGEVIRNTPLIARIKREIPGARIFWVTQYPSLVPRREVHRVLKFGFEASMILSDIEFEVVYSLDKDLEACSLANRVKARVKKGFTQKDGVILPFDDDARRKWASGVFDDLMRANRKHYGEEIFEICGYRFAGEPYLLPEFPLPEVAASRLGRSKPVIALNTGAGDAWKPRLYSTRRWIEVARELKAAKGYEVFVCGGPAEHEKNEEIAREAGVSYFGVMPMLEFIGLLSLADVVATSVSFALHVGVGLGKRIVLLNNTFNAAEFYMYDKGTVLQPDLPCLMCYKNDFDGSCVTRDCMDLVAPSVVVEAVAQGVQAVQARETRGERSTSP
jgi:ADP-heptose:LPS heptosyltransferase